MESPQSKQAQKQLSSFVTVQDDDELAQMILEELSIPRRSYVSVLAGMSSSGSDKELNAIKEEVEETTQSRP